MRYILILLLGLSALLDICAVNPCLDPSNVDYKCTELNDDGLWLDSCEIADDDVVGIASCLDALERATINGVYLHNNSLTTLPEGIFGGLTSLNHLELQRNTLTTLPAGVFQDLTSLETLYLHDNTLTTLPAGIFQNLTSLETLQLENNSLECLPVVPLALAEVDDEASEAEVDDEASTAEIDDDGSSFAAGLHVDPYGVECGCSTANGTNVCGQESCTPGEFGYTCEATTPTTAPTTAPTITPTPVSTVEAEAPASTTPAPYSGSEASSPTPSPSPSGITQTTSPAVSPPPIQKSASDSTPMVAGVSSAVAGAVLIAVGIFLKRRLSSKRKTTLHLAVPPTHDDDDLERARKQQSPDVRPPEKAVPAPGDESDKRSSKHSASMHRDTPAEGDGFDYGDIVHPSLPMILDGPFSSLEDTSNAAVAEGDGARLPGEDAAGGSAENSSTACDSVATTSATDKSTAESAELAEFRQRQHVANNSSAIGEPQPEEASHGALGAASAAERKHSASDIGLGAAVIAAAQELAHHCQFPGVSEAAGAVCMMANLVADSRDNARASEARLQQCSTLIMALNRAARVAEKGQDTVGEVALGMIEDVHSAIFDLVQLVKTYQSKNKLSRLFMSTLFKRRQEELDAVVNQAIMRLQLGLQMQVGQDVRAVKDGMDLYQRSIAESTSESVAESRRIKRQRKLDQVEIPEGYLSITNELLGKGGFGEVYLADYNGHNAAAKVLHIAHDVGTLDGNREHRETSQRKAFVRELEAMMRLRSLNTVNVYGAVTSLPGRMVLVMELLAGGDLLALLKNAETPLPDEQSRRIIRDICAGMAFLHSKNTTHGDLKSANILLDGDGRAKIADFGTSRWSQHTNSTGLATYTTTSSQTTQMSVPWTAPEVLDSEGSSYASDVYSFGIVVWEVMSRKLPWANKTRPSEIMFAVMKGIRPSFNEDAPTDIVDIAKACWCGEPKARTTFRAVLEGMKGKGWSDE